MNDANSLIDQMETLMATARENHNAGTKSGAAKSRKALGDLKKLVTPYRKASVEENR